MALLHRTWVVGCRIALNSASIRCLALPLGFLIQPKFLKRKPSELLVVHQISTHYCRLQSLVFFRCTNMVVVVTVYYDSQRIVNSDILASIRQAIEANGRFDVNNESLGCDPSPGKRKECYIQWRQTPGGNDIADQIEEGKHFSFGRYITSITYGGVVLDYKPHAYLYLHKAWRNTYASYEKQRLSIFAPFVSDRGRILLDNDNLLGDPKPGERKQVRIEVFDCDSHPSHQNFDFMEGDLWPPAPQADLETQAKVDGSTRSSYLSAAASAMSSSAGYR